MVKLSIIIVNYRGWKPLSRCLGSLSSLDNASFSSEVIVVDNFSCDGKLKAFSVQFPSIRFIENTGNFGFSNGNNLGARNSSGKFMLFLNPDTVVSLPALSAMIQLAEDHAEYHIVSCQQENEAGKEENPFGVFPSLKSLTGITRAIFRFSRTRNQLNTQCHVRSVIFPDWVSGSLVLIRREVFNQLGGWSEDFWMYYEDVDLCKRISDIGGKIAFLCNIRIMHQHGGLTRQNKKLIPFYKNEVLKSRHIYISKHFTGMERLLMQIFLVINNLMFDYLIPAFVGLILFMIPHGRVYLFLYIYLLGYYCRAIKRRTWLLEPRSVNFPTK